MMTIARIFRLTTNFVNELRVISYTAELIIDVFRYSIAKKMKLDISLQLPSSVNVSETLLE